MPRVPLTPLQLATRHLAKIDPALKALTEAIGPCTLAAGGEPFEILVRSVVSQLISTAAAKTVYGRLAAATGEAGVTPAGIIALSEEQVRQAGLSRTKAQAILELARRASDERLPVKRLAEMSDEEIAERLIAIRGIGRWTADMFLIFCMGRLDVLPVGDLGLRAGVRDVYKLEDLPSPRRLREIAEPWAPYRSIGTWYMWRQRGAVPQSPPDSAA